jgi:secernin
MCDTLVVVRPSGVFFAKNSDRDPNEAQVLEWHSAGTYAADATVRCTYLEIPQAPRTHAVLISRPFWIWGAEMGTNEHGVTIGNEAVFTKTRVAKEGLLGMDLLRLALERSETAQEAVDVITGLLETHGQGGGAGHEHRSFRYHNSFIVADRTTAFVLETVDRLWRVEAVEAGARSISNGLTIADFAREHSDFINTKFGESARRRARTECLAATVTDAAGMMATLRDHGPDRAHPKYSWINGALSAPCAHAGGLLAATQTTASWVAELSPDGDQHWVTGTAGPCTGLFKPVRVDAPLDLGPTPTDRAETESLWWRHERLHRWVMTDPARLLPLFADERDTLEAKWRREGTAPAAAFAEADVHLRRWTERARAQLGGDRRPWWVRRYWRVRDRRAGLVTGGS